MDGITQALLGATVGKACCGHKLGHKRAVWWGAVGGIIPDFDILARVGGEWASMVHHRGVTHSLWFGPLVGSALGYAVWRRYRAKEDPGGQPGLLRWWVLLFVLAIFTHPLLDLFTTYGTQLLAPFSRQRYAINGVGIVDLFYTVPLIIALRVGRGDADMRRGRRAATIALAATTAYLFVGVWLNHRAEGLAARDLARRGVKVTKVDAYPTLLQLFLRRVVARDDKGALRVGYLSTLAPQPPRWRRFEPPKDALVERLRAAPRGKLLYWFAMGQVAPHLVRDSKGNVVVELDDVRYGLPGTAPWRGFWGVRARFNKDGSMGEVVRFRRGFSGAGKAFVDLFRGALGARL
ncbi:MAG: metal-dependent hydrolase [Myxococcales bacterium]|nr:metal-dependent hydrolase [Myxococcales bacterium]